MVEDKIYIALIIDPEGGFKDYARSILTEKGYQVIESQSEVSGYDLLKKNKPDFIICSDYLPGSSGLGFYYNIREIAKEWEYRFVLVLLSRHYYKFPQGFYDPEKFRMLEYGFTDSQLMNALLEP